MANSKYEYVKTFEQSTTLLPNTYMIVRIDGRGFHKLVPEFCSIFLTKLIFPDFRQNTDSKNPTIAMPWN